MLHLFKVQTFFKMAAAKGAASGSSAASKCNFVAQDQIWYVLILFWYLVVKVEIKWLNNQLQMFQQISSLNVFKNKLFDL